MNDQNQQGREPGRQSPKEGRRPFGPFLILGTTLILLLLILGPGTGSHEISEDAFWYQLYTGRITGVVERPPSRFAGTMRVEREGKEMEQKFTVTVPDTAAVHDRVRALAARRLEAEPLPVESFLEDVAAGRIVPVRGHPLLVRRLQDPRRPDSGIVEEQRFFVDYRDETGQHYAEVVGPKPGTLDIARLTAAIRDRGGEIEEGLVFDLDQGLRTEEGNSMLVYFLGTFGPIVLLLGLFWFFFMRQMRGQGQGLLSFGRSRAVLYNKEKKTGVTFDDVAGIEEAKEEVAEIIQFLKNPGKFQRIGGRIPRGVLLVGPPGTGKTLLAKAIAGEADVPFLSISGSDFVEMFVGVGASRVRDLFKQAKESAPCIVFLDEIDAVGRKRGSGLGGGHDEREQTLNAILVEMDGFGTDQGIIVIAATNRPDVLDPALLRPGRFDREIVIDLPDVKGREQILEVHTKKVKLAPGVDLKAIARGTPGFSGAELAALVNEAAIQAAMQNREAVTQEDLEEARDKVRFGRQKKSRVMDPADKRITAYHEAGHAVVSTLCEHSEPVHKVTIIPRGMALGATMMLPEKDLLHMTRNRVLDELAVLYGGRVAEDVFCSDITSGAANDIQHATRLARLMVTEWGMSERLGPINFSERHGSEFLGAEIVTAKDHSEATVREIDEEVSRILREAHDRARVLILENREAVERVAKALLRLETLHGDEVKALVEGADPDSLRPNASPPPAPEPATKPETRVAPEPPGLGATGQEGLSPA